MDQFIKRLTLTQWSISTHFKQFQFCHIAKKIMEQLGMNILQRRGGKLMKSNTVRPGTCSVAQSSIFLCRDFCQKQNVKNFLPQPLISNRIQIVKLGQVLVKTQRSLLHTKYLYVLGIYLIAVNHLSKNWHLYINLQLFYDCKYS